MMSSAPGPDEIVVGFVVIAIGQNRAGRVQALDDPDELPRDFRPAAVFAIPLFLNFVADAPQE